MKVTEVKQVTDFKHINTFRATFEHRGRRGEWLYVSRDSPKREGSPQSVAIAPMLGDKLVLIKQYRVPLRDYVIELPAGLVEPGHGIIETAARELKEETGLTIKRVVHVSPIILNSPGLTDESTCCVFAEVEGEATTEGTEHCEDIEVLVLGKEEVLALVARQDVKMDAKCWILMYMGFALAAAEDRDGSLPFVS